MGFIALKAIEMDHASIATQRVASRRRRVKFCKYSSREGRIQRTCKNNEAQINEQDLEVLCQFETGNHTFEQGMQGLER